MQVEPAAIAGDITRAADTIARALPPSAFGDPDVQRAMLSLAAAAALLGRAHHPLTLQAPPKPRRASEQAVRLAAGTRRR